MHMSYFICEKKSDRKMWIEQLYVSLEIYNIYKICTQYMTTSVDVVGENSINSVANSAAEIFEQRSLRKILLKLTYLLNLEFSRVATL
jgi:hypothetical protein